MALIYYLRHVWFPSRKSVFDGRCGWSAFYNADLFAAKVWQLLLVVAQLWPRAKLWSIHDNLLGLVCSEDSLGRLLGEWNGLRCVHVHLHPLLLGYVRRDCSGVKLLLHQGCLQENR